MKFELKYIIRKKGGEYMNDFEERDESTLDMENYLKGYRLNLKLMRLDKYEKDYLGWKDEEEEPIKETLVARAKMFEIRHFVVGMKNGDEKLLLYYHYIRGESIEKCAELLGISRSSGFRLKKRALRMAAEYKNTLKASNV